MSSARDAFLTPPSYLSAPALPAAHQYGGGAFGRWLADTRSSTADLVRPSMNRLRARTRSSKQSLALLESLVDSQSGQTGVVVCNGPSLNKTDLDLVAGHPYLLLNRGYLLGDRLPGPPTALCVHDPLVLAQFGREIGAVDCTVLAPRTAKKDLARAAATRRTAYVEIARTWKFATRPHPELHHGATVTFWALQLGYWLGWSKLVIVGMDHRFRGQDGVPSRIHESGPDQDHFTSDYAPPGTRVHNPNVRASEYSYALSRHAWESADRRIVDCTIGGACPVFEKGELASEL